MADVIRVKRTESAGVEPLSLAYGELAVNVTDKALWVGSSSNAAVLLNASSSGESTVPIGYKEQPLVVNKGSISNTTAGQLYSLWRAAGFPTIGNIPTTTPTVCTSATTGALIFNNANVETKSYLGTLSIRSSNSGTLVIIEDRLAHMAGLVGNVTTAQTVNLSATIAGLSASRIGAASYSELSWGMEWYADTGSTATTATVNVTYSDNSTGNLSPIALAVTTRASIRIDLKYYIPVAAAILNIKSINTVTLSASTGAAGNLGFTMSRNITSIGALLGSYPTDVHHPTEQMPDVQNDACISFVIMANNTTTGILTAYMQLLQKASTVGSVFNRQEFTSNGTFVVPDGVTQILLSGVAQGGAGGQSTGGTQGAAGGGSSGEWILRKKFTVTPGSSHAVVIAPLDSSSFGALQTLRQGYNGTGGNQSYEGIFDSLAGASPGWGEPGGAGGVGFDTGFAGIANAHHGNGGNGGSSPFGAGGSGGSPSNNGGHGTGYGAGGGGDGGGLVTSSGTNTGSPGLWIVEW
jgi:hypothetical protein